MMNDVVEKKEEMKTKEAIPGQYKQFRVEREFELNGRVVKPGEILEQLTPDQVRKLTFHRVGTMIGGTFTVEPMRDGAHCISSWNKSYSETDEWLTVEFLQDVFGYGVKAGDRRRFHKSDALEMHHCWLDQDRNPMVGILPWPPPVIRIMQNKPVRSRNVEETAERAKIV